MYQKSGSTTILIISSWAANKQPHILYISTPNRRHKETHISVELIHQRHTSNTSHTHAFQNVFLLCKLLRKLVPSNPTQTGAKQHTCHADVPFFVTQGSINCHNVVNRFGDRCKLCLALKSGASMTDGMLPEDAYRGKNSSRAPVETSSKHHYRSQDTSSRSIRVDSRHRK